MPDALLDPLLSMLSVMSLELRGSVVAAQGNIDDAKSLFARAAKEEKALGYREPPIYIRPVGETEGAAMLRARRSKDAKAAFEGACQSAPIPDSPCTALLWRMNSSVIARPHLRLTQIF